VAGFCEYVNELTGSISDVNFTTTRANINFSRRTLSWTYLRVQNLKYKNQPVIPRHTRTVRNIEDRKILAVSKQPRVIVMFSSN
jgi:hypothetical protein